MGDSNFVKIDHDAQLVKEREEADLQIYKEANELKEVATILNEKVESQQEQLNEIEKNVKETEENIEDGVQDVTIADRYHTCCGCCRCCCSIL